MSNVNVLRLSRPVFSLSLLYLAPPLQMESEDFHENNLEMEQPVKKYCRESASPAINARHTAKTRGSLSKWHLSTVTTLTTLLMRHNRLTSGSTQATGASSLPPHGCLSFIPSTGNFFQGRCSFSLTDACQSWCSANIYGLCW